MSREARAASAPAGFDALRALSRACRAVGATPEPNLLLAPQVDSTQVWARRILDASLVDGEDPEPFVCAALEQSAGRGREQRSWSSGRGGVYATLVVRIADESTLQSLPARVAVALAELVNPILGGRCRIKWPNDLVVERRKLGGILVDAVSAAEGSPWALVGFGLNHSQRSFGAAADVATSLAAEVGLALPFFEEFFAGAIAAAAKAAATEAPGWAKAYRALSAHLPGDRISARLGERSVEGAFAGFDEHGFLELDTAAGREVVRSGEVFAW